MSIHEDLERTKAMTVAEIRQHGPANSDEDAMMLLGRLADLAMGRGQPAMWALLLTLTEMPDVIQASQIPRLETVRDCSRDNAEMCAIIDAAISVLRLP